MTASRTPSSGPSMAVFMMVGACALIAMTTLLAKALGQTDDGLHPLQISAARFWFAFLSLVPFVLWHRPNFHGTPWSIHIGRALCGWAGVSCLFAAAAAMPLADATAISFLSPLITMLLAIPLLGETIGRWRWGAAAIALVGALCLIRPGTDTFQIVAVIALAAALFMGMEAILIKKLSAAEPTLRILAINNAIGSVIALAGAAAIWVTPSPRQWLMLAAIGVVMVTAQTLFIQAMRRADASFLVPFFYVTLVFSAAYDFAVFDVIPAPLSLFGAALIIAGAMVISWRERRAGAGADRR